MEPNDLTTCIKKKIVSKSENTKNLLLSGGVHFYITAPPTHSQAQT